MNARTVTPADALRAVAEFDHPFTVHPDGTLTDAPAGTHAPEVYHSDTDDVDIAASGWEALTGYTGQHGYRGAVMHASEFVGGGLARDILETPGTYVVVVVNVWPHVTYPHEWSDSGARCTRTGCGLIGNGTDNGSCPAHPDYVAELVDDDEDPEPAGWAVLRRTAVTIREVIHHGNYRAERVITVRGGVTAGDMQGIARECPYPATLTDARAGELADMLEATGTAAHGWVTWTQEG